MPESREELHLGDNAAFVLGNGPSLKNVDFGSLTPFKTIGMNAAYRHWDRIEWRPTHYACLDLVVGMSHLEEIRRLIREGHGKASGSWKPIGQFFLRSNLIEALGVDGDDERVINFDALRPQTPILQVSPITTGSHALLWAQQLGFGPIVLLGIDGNYKEIVEGAAKRDGTVLEIAEMKSNPNYFFEDYQRPGDLYNVPNPIPDLHASAWWKAALDLSSEGAVVANGNPMSSVRVFPFVDAQELLKSGSAPLKPAEENPLLARPGGSGGADAAGEAGSGTNDAGLSSFGADKTSLKRKAGLAAPFLLALFCGVLAFAGAVSLALLLVGLLSAAGASVLLRLRRKYRHDMSVMRIEMENMQMQVLEAQRQVRALRRASGR